VKRRWLQDRQTGKLIEIPQDYKPPERKTPYIRGDIEPFVSHVDGSYITSRNELRAHNARNGVVQTAEYGEGNFCDPAAKKKREDIILGKDKATNDQRLKDVIDAYKKETGDL